MALLAARLRGPLGWPPVPGGTPGTRGLLHAQPPGICRSCGRMGLPGHEGLHGHGGDRGRHGLPPGAWRRAAHPQLQCPAGQGRRGRPRGHVGHAARRGPRRALHDQRGAPHGGPRGGARRSKAAACAGQHLYGRGAGAVFAGGVHPRVLPHLPRPGRCCGCGRQTAQPCECPRAGASPPAGRGASCQRRPWLGWTRYALLRLAAGALDLAASLSELI
mmetsp:Transcript_21068/g.70774  ORF Transcript_21068/g.70774 Transcript_21068/m.70774 type:complete len:218 (-) Transcript_21068:223-876(-)